MKVAFATTDGINVDEHFGRSGKFAVYEFTEKGYGLVEMRVFSDGRDEAVEGTKGLGAEHDDAVSAKVERLSDCSIVYVTNIGGPSAARLSGRGIMPVKLKAAAGIEEEARRLMETITNSPPPWLRKLISR